MGVSARKRVEAIDEMNPGVCAGEYSVVGTQEEER